MDSYVPFQSKFAVFKYSVGSHNVFKVNGTGFQNCIKPPLSEALKTGNDVIVLATPGQKWYICGVANHCDKAGMRLSIFVNAKPSPPIHVPSPSSPLRKPKDFIVGDERGWTKFFDYQAWANGKDFRVGDRLGISQNLDLFSFVILCLFIVFKISFVHHYSWPF